MTILMIFERYLIASQVRVAAERVDDLPVLLARAAPTVGWQGLGLILNQFMLLNMLPKNV